MRAYALGLLLATTLAAPALAQQSGGNVIVMRKQVIEPGRVNPGPGNGNEEPGGETPGGENPPTETRTYSWVVGAWSVPTEACSDAAPVVRSVVCRDDLAHPPPIPPAPARSPKQRALSPPTPAARPTG